MEEPCSACDNLELMMDSMTNLTSQFDMSGLTDAMTGNQQASTAMKSLGTVLCGDSSAFNVDDSYGIGLSGAGRRRKKRATNEWEPSDYDRREMIELPSEFCRDMYKQIVTSDGGRIIWTYLKPLLRGKIPFAPNSDLIIGVMKEATSLFTELTSLQDFLADLAKSMEGLGAVSSNEYKALKAALQNPFVSGAVKDSFGVDLDSLLMDLESLQSIDQQAIDTLLMLGNLLTNVSQCVSTNRLVAFKSEEELLKYAKELTLTNNILAGVVFMNITKAEVKLPKHVSYKIRMNLENVAVTSRYRQMVWNPNPEDNFATDMRYLRGFLQLQDQIERTIVQHQIATPLQPPTVKFQHFPHPCWMEDIFLVYISSFFFPIVMTLAWLVAVGSAIRNIVYDKENRLEETMMMMGLQSGVNWLGWFINTFGGQLIMSAILTLFLHFGKLMPYSDPIYLFCYLGAFSLSTTMMCYLISAFFSRATLAALAGLIIYLISYLPFVILTAMELESSMLFWHKALLCLSSTSAFAYGAHLIAHLEQSMIGLQWESSVDPNVWGEGNFNPAWACYMMLIDAAIYGIIGWYIRHVFPGKYGVAQPCYFPLSPVYWGCCKKKSQSESKKQFSDYGNKNKDTGATCEDEPADLPIGIAMHELTMVYNRGKKTAVDELSVNLYRGQITAFLGQNGAGKTSTINMLTGLLSPSGGTAFIEGNDILRRISSVRKDLGICPQADVLFNYLTVAEHMDLYLSLKSSMGRVKRKEEIDSMLESTGLVEQRHTKAAKLSGGQRRRLSVGLAFIGGSRVVILDEPTSGVDPAARRSIWDLIVEHRHDRTILLCTHHLDEADILADRILILHRGKLVCQGSPLFLCKQYGSGYHLTMAKDSSNNTMTANFQEDSECDSQSVLELIRQHVPEAYLAEEVGSELTYILPTDQGQTHHFQQLFRELDQNLLSLHVASYGVSASTLEEVFLKLTLVAEQGGEIDARALRHRPMIGNIDADSDKDSGVDTNVSSPEDSPKGTLKESDIAVEVRDTSPRMSSLSSAEHLAPLGVERGKRLRGCSLSSQQFWALIYKRFFHNVRDYRSYLSQIILPIAFVCLAMGCTLIKPSNDNEPNLQMSPAILGPNVQMFFRNSKADPIANQYINTLLQSPGVGTTCMKNSSLRYLCTKQQTGFESKPIPSGEESYFSKPRDCICEAGSLKCPVGAGGAPMPYLTTAAGNLLYNISDTPWDTQKYLLQNHLENYYHGHGGWEFDRAINDSAAVTVWWKNKGWHNLPAYYNALNNMMLRASKGASQQYGISAYSHPFEYGKDQLNQWLLVQGIAETGIALTILCAFCFVPAGYTIYLVLERTNFEKRLQLICGVGAGLYWIAAFCWDMMSYLFTVALAVLVAYLFGIDVYTARLNLAAFTTILVLFGWSTIPLMYLLVRGFKDTSTGYMVMFLLNLIIGITTTAAVFLLNLFLHLKIIKNIVAMLECVLLIFPQFCLGDGLVRLSRNQFIADIQLRFHTDSYVNPFSLEMMGWHFVALGVQGFIFLLVNLIVEDQACCKGRSAKAEDKRLAKPEPPSHHEDEDVSLERQRVITGGATNDLLILHSLKKEYKRGFKKIVAVNSVTVGIPRGEIFGLLGVNGAGKTTTFNMMTGEVIPTAGEARLQGSIISQHQPLMKQRVGYCPQADALDPMLQVSEVLHFFAALKGIPLDSIPPVLEAAMQRFGLTKFRNHPVKSLSGGTKRKLSTAVGLIGDPDLLLLDEPTTGMDPHTRRLVWSNIQQLRQAGRSVVLTSHSMAECDALCTRIAIMVNGRFQCLGSSQRLKHKFGTGYTIMLKARHRQTDMSQIVNFLKQQFPGAVLKDQHLNMAEVEVPLTSVNLGDIFGTLESAPQSLDIQDYSVTQTSLDQVFLNFSKYQTDGTELPSLGHSNLSYINDNKTKKEQNLIPSSPSSRQNDRVGGSLRGMPIIQADFEEDNGTTGPSPAENDLKNNSVLEDRVKESSDGSSEEQIGPNSLSPNDLPKQPTTASGTDAQYEVLPPHYGRVENTEDNFVRL